MFDQKEYNRKWRAEHKEDIKAYNDEYYKKHKKEISLERANDNVGRGLRNINAVNWRDNHPERSREVSRNSKLKNKEKIKIQHLVGYHSKLYPLDEKCIFCGRTENLEHGHYSYEDAADYVTCCHQCNIWMDKFD